MECHIQHIDGMVLMALAYPRVEMTPEEAFSVAEALIEHANMALPEGKLIRSRRKKK